MGDSVPFRHGRRARAGSPTLAGTHRRRLARLLAHAFATACSEGIWALYYMWHHGAPAEAMPIVANLLADDSDPEIRAHAARVVGKARAPAGEVRLVFLLSDRLRREPDPETRRAVIDAMGDSGAEGFVHPLLVVVSGPSEVAAVDAIRALHRIVPSPRLFVPALLHALQNPNADVRAAAIGALGDAKADGAVRAKIVEVSKTDPHHSVRKSARWALAPPAK